MRPIIWILLALTAIGVYAFYNYNTGSVDNFSERRVYIQADSVHVITADMNDADDPTQLVGVDLLAGEVNPTSGNYTAEMTSSDQTVVPRSLLTLSGSGATRNLKIKAIAPGYTTIRVKISNGKYERSYTINYAASQTKIMETKRWHSGLADASAAIAIDDEYMLVADDESNYLYLYNRTHSGPPLKVFDVNPDNRLALGDSSAGKWKEVDIEGAVTSTTDPAISYWIGSMSNNSAFLNKPNRNKLFSIRASGKGNKTMLTNQGNYNMLREKLVAWGDLHGYDFKSSSAIGKDAKAVDGFNIEGMVFGPDDKTLFIAFRAPLVPMGNRTKAVIAPIRNFESWFNKGQPVGEPVIGAPIELDLGGRGIRDIIRMPKGDYVIMAGSSGWDIVPGAYSWTGRTNDQPVKISAFELTGLNVEGILPVYENGKVQNKIQVITDNGSEILYHDTLAAKDLVDRRLKKFSSVIFPLR